MMIQVGTIHMMIQVGTIHMMIQVGTIQLMIQVGTIHMMIQVGTQYLHDFTKVVTLSHHDMAINKNIKRSETPDYVDTRCNIPLKIDQ